MKFLHKAIALAACGAALSAAAEADVTIYGRIHEDIESTLSGMPGAVAQTKVANDTSRIGFKGTEDLGNGLSTVWQVESGVAVDDGSSGGSNAWAGRESFVGLSSNTLGTIKTGNFLVPVDDVHYIAGNQFQYGTGISNDAAMWSNGGSLATGGFDVRAGNSVSYQTPTMHGFTSRVQYSLTTGTGSSETTPGGASVVSGNILYNVGPWSVGYGVQSNRNMQTMSSNFYQSGLTNMLAAGYNFGTFYVGGVIEHDILRNINLSGNDRSRNYASVTANYSLGNGVFTALVGKAASWTGAAGLENSDAKMASLAYNYKLSKTTQLYLLYTTIHNDTNGGYVLGGNASTTPALAVQHSVALGMWVNF